MSRSLIVENLLSEYMKKASIRALVMGQNHYRKKMLAMFLFIIPYYLVLYYKESIEEQLGKGLTELVLYSSLLLVVFYMYFLIKKIKKFCQKTYGVTYEKFSFTWNNEGFRKIQFDLVEKILVEHDLNSLVKINLIISEIDKEIENNSPETIFGLKELSAVMLIIFGSFVNRTFELASGDKLIERFLGVSVISIGFYLFIRPHLGKDGMVYSLFNSKKDNYEDLRGYILDLRFKFLSNELI